MRRRMARAVLGRVVRSWRRTLVGVWMAIASELGQPSWRMVPWGRFTANSTKTYKKHHQKNDPTGQRIIYRSQDNVTAKN